MQRSRTNTAITRKLATQEYRNKSPHTKSLMLLEDLDIPITEVSKAVKIDRRSINRAKRAKEEGRELGKNGRPPIFNKEDNDELLRRLYDLRETTTLTKQILKTEVITDISNKS
jgi:hypothetical protein